MPVVTYEGVVENGQVHLPSEVVLPEKATVYVVVPQTTPESEAIEVHVLKPQRPDQPPPRIRSPRFTHPEQAADFVKQVYPEEDDA